MSRNYIFNIPKTNLASRTDNLTGQTESFSYDNLNRLTNCFTPATNIAYEANGNISSKTEGGSYTYWTNKLHAVKDVVKTPGTSSQPLQNISYTKFNKALNITQYLKTTPPKTLTYNITYGPDQQRVKTIYTDTSGYKTIRYYSGSYQKDSIVVGSTKTVKKIHYIMGGTGLVAVYIKWSTGQDSMFYVCKDRQGSIVALVKQNGTVSERFSYDAWGRRRNPSNWADYNVPAPRLISRGYTGHEMLDGFGLINMNGRMYDPVIGRVLSPDNYVQDPTNTQCYNRYSYCLNNPLRYTDPSGWLTEAAWADISRTWNNMVSDPENFFNGTYSWSSGSRNDIGGIGDICTYSSSEDLMLSTLIDYNNQYSSWSNTTLSSAFGKSSAVDGLKIRWVTWAGTPSNPYQWLTGVRLQNGTFISKFSEGEGKANITNNSKSVNSGEANVEWISQYDTRVPAHGRKACKRACYIMNPDALRGMNNGYFVGKEKAKSFITTNETLQGYQYLNQQLSLNRSVIVGVGRDLAGYWGNNANNDYTTDHFVVIDYAVGGEYHFLDPGTRNPAIGTSVNNVFRLGVNGLYSGSSYGAPMTITWIGLNR